MSGRKLLIDTNVFIGLEDEREVAPEFATLQQLCAQHSVRIFIHERRRRRHSRDRDVKRRAISLSKIRKFEQPKRVSQPPKADLEAKFGAMPKPNDAVTEQRRVSPRDGRPGARDVRNDKRPAGVIPRQQGHAADWVRGHEPDRPRAGLAHNGLAVSEVGRFDERRHRRAIGAYGVWRE
jgi:hypothetical protein